MIFRGKDYISKKRSALSRLIRQQLGLSLYSECTIIVSSNIDNNKVPKIYKHGIALIN